MKTFALAGLLAVASALPQYGSSTASHSHGRHHHGAKLTGSCSRNGVKAHTAAHNSTATGYGFNTTYVPSTAASNDISVDIATKAASALDAGSSASVTSTQIVYSTEVVHNTVFVGTGQAERIAASSTHRTRARGETSGSGGATIAPSAAVTTAAAVTHQASAASSRAEERTSRATHRARTTSKAATTTTSDNTREAATTASRSVASSSSTQPASPTTSSSNTTNSTSTNSDFLRGVNIGNWLILEKWMDESSTFTGAFASASDQYSFDSSAGSAAALQRHWSSWFTEADVAAIQGYGFNALRIPVGFWAFDNSGTPYQQGSAFWLDTAIGWARKYGMKVLVDCHGSPGSQNGKDHSGHAGAVEWQQGDNLAKSTRILVDMARKYGAANYSDVVWGIEMVNEPTAAAPNSFSKSQSWAADTYAQMLAVAENPSLRIVTHDSFMGPQKFVSIAQNLTSAGTGLTARGGTTTFGVDQHNYQLYTDENNALDQDAHVALACTWSTNLATARDNMPTIVGEWSALTNICAKSDGTTVPHSTGCGSDDDDAGCSCTSEDPAKWTSALVEQVRRYVEAQLEVYERNSDGYFLWSWKGPGGWGVEGPAAVGAFPKNVVSDRKFSNVCGSS